MSLDGLLARSWDLQGARVRLGGEGETWRVEPPDGPLRILKVQPADEPAALLELEHTAARAVAEAVDGVEVPRPVPTRRGESWTEVEPDPDGGGSGSSENRRARLLTYVEGEPWGHASPGDPVAWVEAGRRLGEVARALAGVEHPAAHRTHPWDLARAGAHRGGEMEIEDRDERVRVARALARWSAEAAPWLEEVPWGLIHGDLNDENVRVRDGRIVGLLDFGDALHNPLVCELAIALTYLLLEADDPLARGADLVRGYHERRPLVRREVELLPSLVCGRLAVSLIMAARRRRLDPHREAWFVTVEGARDALARYLELTPVETAHAWAAGTGVEPFPERGPPVETRLAARHAVLPGTLSVSYRTPLAVVRGRGAYLVDRDGRPHLDLYNNVCHVGHAHPRVARAACAQLRRLNTNTRYLYDQLPAYAARLAATFPDRLDRVFLVNSGTEANELALRLARAHTGRREVVVLEGAYHGHSTTLAEISPYKFRGPGGSGTPPPWLRVFPLPDGYRGKHRGTGRETGEAYGRDAARRIADMDPPPGAFLAETLPSCGGQILPPPGYFEAVFHAVRAAGGLCILDEVQVGFGRVGTDFWAFQRYDVVPDVVVLGKPMGNGHPLAAVITTAEVAHAFTRTGMEFFSTFGGNPVSCAVGQAVLDVVEEEGLQRRAREVGSRLLEGLGEVARRHPRVGDVRGAGLFVGVEMVADPRARTPDRAAARALVEGLRERGILTGTDGPEGNVVKIKPPMVVDESDVDRAVDEVDALLAAGLPAP